MGHRQCLLIFNHHQTLKGRLLKKKKKKTSQKDENEFFRNTRTMNSLIRMKMRDMICSDFHNHYISEIIDTNVLDL